MTRTSASISQRELACAAFAFLSTLKHLQITEVPPPVAAELLAFVRLAHPSALGDELAELLAVGPERDPLLLSTHKYFDRDVMLVGREHLL